MPCIRCSDLAGRGNTPWSVRTPLKSIMADALGAQACCQQGWMAQSNRAVDIFVDILGLPWRDEKVLASHIAQVLLAKQENMMHDKGLHEDMRSPGQNGLAQPRRTPPVDQCSSAAAAPRPMTA